MEYIGGQPLSDERYPDYKPSDELITNLIGISEMLGPWQISPHSRLGVYDYAAKIEKYFDYGLLNSSERDKLQLLIPAYRKDIEFNHGDFLFSNLIASAAADYVPVDWEYAGFYMPGFDLALLHTILSEYPDLQHQVEAAVKRRMIDIPFLINKAVVLLREIRMHRDLSDTQAFKHKRLAFLELEWERFQNKVCAI